MSTEKFQSLKDKRKNKRHRNGSIIFVLGRALSLAKERKFFTE